MVFCMGEQACYSFCDALRLNEINKGNTGMPKIPTKGESPVICMGSSVYKYDYATKEVVLLCTEGKEVYRKKVDPTQLMKYEWKWVGIARLEARMLLNLDEEKKEVSEEDSECPVGYINEEGDAEFDNGEIYELSEEDNLYVDDLGNCIIDESKEAESIRADVLKKQQKFTPEEVEAIK